MAEPWSEVTRPSESSDDADRTALTRELSLFDALMINVGITLGSAIFIVPAIIIANVGTAFMSGVVWIIAGVLSWFGAVTFAELAVLYPRAGGEYVYLEKAYTRFWGFLYGWTLFSVIQTASIAAVAVAFMTYFDYFVPMSPTILNMSAIGLILILSIWNCISLRTSANTQNSTTVAKLALVAVMVASCFWYGGDGVNAFRQMVPTDPATRTVAGFGAAMVAALWAFDGWVSVTFVGGEVKDPSRALPRALSYSALGLIGIYLLITNGYIYALPVGEMALSERVAADAVENVFGNVGGGLVSLAVVVSCFAALNGFIFTGARVYYAMALDGAFFGWAAKLSARKIPVYAILAQGIWASALVLTGRYDQLFTYVVFTSWLFYMLGAFGVIVLRYREPHRPRPYRAFGYPGIPIFFAVFAAALLLQTLWDNPRDSLIGLGIMLIGVPAYYYWTRNPAGHDRISP